jgi:hypothetical protein
MIPLLCKIGPQSFKNFLYFFVVFVLSRVPSRGIVVRFYLFIDEVFQIIFFYPERVPLPLQYPKVSQPEYQP